MQTQTTERSAPAPHSGSVAANQPLNDAAAPQLTDELAAPTVSRGYQCQCGRPVFLRNSQCLACQTPLGYVADRLGVVPLAPAGEEGAFTVFGDEGGKRYRRCENFLGPSGCNWLVPIVNEGEEAPPETHGLRPGLCLACSATRTIPDLSVPENAELWNKLEQAKRRLISQLLALGLPVVSRLADPQHGLAFDFLSNLPGAPHVMTGHDSGVITLNAEEADDSVRERIRAQMREPYRTLLGHFRHEIGHYYWDLLVAPTGWLEPCRQLFGDERADYGQALRNHYDNGPPPDWASRFVTSYASAHPWEDWAETWAHYLHMADTADTALSFGVNASNVELSSDLFKADDLWQPDHPDAAQFLDFLNGWVRLTNVLNEFSRSMGQPDNYPFVLPHAVVGKLQFIHQVIADQRNGVSTAPTAFAAPVEPAMSPDSSIPMESAAPADETAPAPVNEPVAPVPELPQADAPLAPVDAPQPVAASGNREGG
ncbi:putative zinc-binding metallopeptidase [Variovorax sp. J22R133]|uniref:zinc-binding metallopeptidase family protein n=1 Tax=Variovorax brevis TaxID=3053503 RepID=UPI00257797AD|nr:putative zinc-binding metallopeptidase [Variovorax sp. J22R133]MDM0115550.1 putative zinc-binding metallopeptidase [Variovorax sp. J22R133]